jgi:alkanesulfonate monooxygenase SsuD/methylene tetrahydromethanopterin reductase-like flavin-dependent oxidoreductase (luciferase family)
MAGVGGPSTARPFRFGVVAMPTPMRTAGTLQQSARAAAQHGYSIFLVPDNIFMLSPMPSLAVAASAADIRVGTLVMSSALRAPAVAAWEAHSLSVLTEGRFELGIGAGLTALGPALEAAFGIELGTPAQRIGRVEEVINRVAALSGDGHVHITMAAGGPKMRSLAGRVADSVLLADNPYVDAARLDSLVTAFRQSAGDRADQIELATNLTMVGDGPIEPEGLKALGLDVERLHASDAVSVLRGTTAEMCDELRRRRERWGVSYIMVGEAVMEQFAPVVEELVGR